MKNLKIGVFESQILKMQDFCLGSLQNRAFSPPARGSGVLNQSRGYPAEIGGGWTLRSQESLGDQAVVPKRRRGLLNI